jgi:phenylalanyl-tRNA synthetase alpha chain
MHEDIVKALHPLERKVLPHIKSDIYFSKVISNTKFLDVEVLRALQWLAAKGILILEEENTEVATLGANGRLALEHGLPERRFLKAVEHAPRTLDALKRDIGIDEVNVSLGLLKSKGAITFSQGHVGITPHGREMLSKSTPEEYLINKLKEEHAISRLTKEEKDVLMNLKRRKDLVVTSVKKDFYIKLTDTGREIAKMDLSKIRTIDKLTPEIIRSKEWESQEFRPYELSGTIPRINRGRRHFVSQAIISAKRIWLDMGFKEMTGPMLQTSFWNFDALFTAQDHPVREMQDTFFIKDPKEGKLPSKLLVESVRKTHEDGWTTGSTGWQYEWMEDEARKNVLRTHTTVLSARTLSGLKKEDLPAKFFAVGKCFRNETLDWSHLFEFNQTEGIVIDENANFRHLLGYLKAFFKKMGYEKARFRPAYFPYTEFSVEIDVFHPVHKKWFELGGAGIFRPEVVKPLLGMDVPVLAWGPGFDRIIIDFFKITDIRELYKNDLKQLRDIREWTRC